MIFLNRRKKKEALQQITEAIEKINKIIKAVTEWKISNDAYSTAIARQFYCVMIAQRLLCQELKAAGIDIDHAEILKEVNEHVKTNWVTIEKEGLTRSHELGGLFEDLDRFVNS